MHSRISTRIGFSLAVLLIVSLFFGTCASAAVNTRLSENITHLSVTGGTDTISPAPGNVSELLIQDMPETISPAVMAPVNPDLLVYVQEREMQKMQATNPASAGTTADQEHGFGYVPPPVSMSYLKGPFIVQDTGSSSQDSIPAPGTGAAPSYDLRTTGKVTPVKNQLTSDTCWAFATYGSLESYLLPGETWSFSENNMKNLLSTNYPEGYDRGSEDPGNYIISTAYLARWSGPVSQADDPFNPSSPLSPTDKPVREHVQNVYFLPDRTGPTDNTNIQNAIQAYGSVATTMRWEGATGSSTVYWNEATNSYYDMGSGTPNHGVTIVGWDDTYDKSKFSTVPPGDGAFIVKNSWGVPWGENGYFYLSYYDTNAGLTSAVFTAESPTNYNHIYQYDPLGMVTRFYFSGTPRTGWMANVFTSTRTETLSAVSFYTSDTNTAYQVNIYKNPDSSPVIRSSGASWSGSGTFGNAGYHTVAVSPGVPLTPGDTFSAVVKLTDPAYDYWAPVEYYSTSPSFRSSKATASAGQSYYSTSGTSWTDLTTAVPESNFCIKAFTNDAGTGNLISTIGVFRPSTHLYYRDFNRNGLWDGAVTDRVSSFGLSEDIPVAGDWSGDNISEIGVFRPSTHLYYRDFNGNGLWDGAVTDRVSSFGLSGDIPVAGDWNGDNISEIGVFRPSTHLYYRDFNGNGLWDGAVTDRVSSFGLSEDIPVAGDWNGDNISEIGVFRPSTHLYYRDFNGNGLWDGAVTDRVSSFGLSGDIPVAGDWNGDNISEIGVFRPSTHLFYLDFNSNGVWNGAIADRAYNFGLSGDIPVAGIWS